MIYPGRALQIYASCKCLYVFVRHTNYCFTNAVGCFDFDTVEVKTLPELTDYVPNAFSPNGDGLNDLFRVIPVGIATTDYIRIFTAMMKRCS